MNPAEKTDLLRAIQSGSPIPVDTRLQEEILINDAPALDPAVKLCREFRQSLPSEVTQDFVTVPEDWNHPEGHKIKVFFYARLIKDEDAHLLKPLVFFNGGPSSDSHSSYTLMESQLSSQNMSFVYIDQRGTGCSDPYPISPINLETATRLTLYGSRAIVQDAEAIRLKLLGSQSKWHAFGQSFGGYIVHRYIETAPHSLSGAFAHGSSIMHDTIDWLSERIRSQKRVSEEYFNTYPNDLAQLQRVRALIAETRCFTSSEGHDHSQICGPALMDAMTILLGFHDSWSTLHQWVQNLLKTDRSLNEPVLANFVRLFVFGAYETNGFAASVISMMELSPGYTDSTACQELHARLEKAGEHPLTWPVNECRILSALKDPWNATLNVLHAKDAISLETIALSLKQEPELHFYLYSGEKDVFVPVATFRDEIAELGSRVIYKNFPNSGHEGFYSEQQVWDNLLQSTNP
jgi:pimeloyl-ACP methyl ester carboxylesterase